eukprot:jgi/Bigna1/70052/fgenesh1_pg.10_\
MHVTIIDRLPTPYGLVRSGVAPDHESTKSCMADFSATLDHPRCSFYGNLEVGTDVSLNTLQSAYDAVVLAYGASGDRKLGIPGENLDGVHSAREFVNWYNGHPDYVEKDFESLLTRSASCVVIGKKEEEEKEESLSNVLVSSEQRASVFFLKYMFGHGPGRISTAFFAISSFPFLRVLIEKYTKELSIMSEEEYGQGNVAIDVSRIILSSTDKLKTSDICQHALDALDKSTVSDVSVLGRRGPAQSAFTIKELRELTKLDGVACVISPADIEKGSNPSTLEEISSSRPAKRKFELMKSVAAQEEKVNAEEETRRRLHIRFFLSPVAILPSEEGGGQARAVECAVTQLEGAAGRQKAIDTGERVIIEADLVLTSVGYKSYGIEDVSFDPNSHTVPSVQGRVVALPDDDDRDGVPAATPSIIPGLYVAGWLKRGPSGIIGTNIPDAKETVAAIREDLDAGKLGGSKTTKMAEEDALRLARNEDGLLVGGKDGCKLIVDTKGWRSIERVETVKGTVLWLCWRARVNRNDARRRHFSFSYAFDWMWDLMHGARTLQAIGKPREKVVSVQEMLQIAHHSNE